MDKGHRSGMSWGRFAGMTATSTVVMFFLMYQLVYEPGHAAFSLNRAMASLVSGSVMAVIMLAFMWPMYPDRKVKLMVTVGAILAFSGLVTINRSQTLIDDVDFMKSMIPHHSIAINNARKADISDPRVRELADEIIAAQVREIAEMKALLADIDANGERGSGERLPARPAKLTPDMVPEIEAAVE